MGFPCTDTELLVVEFPCVNNTVGCRWGYRVIETVGTNITKLNPSQAFTVTFATVNDVQGG